MRRRRAHQRGVAVALALLVASLAACDARPVGRTPDREPAARAPSDARTTPTRTPAPDASPAPSPRGIPIAEAPLVRTRMVGADAIEMVDARTDHVILSPTGQPVWEPLDQSNPASRPRLTLAPTGDGFDLILEYHNTTNRRASLGRVTIGGFRFGNVIHTRDFRYDGKESTLEHSGRPVAPGGWYYPDGWYAPVLALREDPYTVGVSVQYPIMEYKHQVRMRVATTRGRFAREGLPWVAEIFLNPEAPDINKYSPEGDLAPGERRRYVVSVRIARQGRPWVETFAPYRDYFHQTYGGVAYERDPRPVHGVSVAVRGRQSRDNPYGFTRENLRPDRHGWKPWVDLLVARRQTGWERVMVWSPSGVAPGGADRAHVFRFVSPWMDAAGRGMRTGDGVSEFRRVGLNGVDLGFWWGRSAQVLDDWSDENPEELDPDNPTHVARAFRELDLAVESGVTTIGLGAFRRMPAWRAERWLEMMQDRAPGVRFVLEPISGDVLHRLAPAFLVATRPAQAADLRLEAPHALADYLLPGHETWGLIRRDRLESFLGRSATDADAASEARRVAALGYVPVVGFHIEARGAFEAAESWDVD